jgi:O-antigen/teichoic acid export membrane protein
VLTLFGLSASLSVPATSMLNVHGHAGTQTAISLALLVTHLVLSVFLLQRFGLLGGAVATTIVFAVGTLATWRKVREYTGAWPFGADAIREALAEPRW